MKVKLKKIIDNPDTPQGRFFILVVNCLIIFSMVTFAIGTLPDLSSEAQNILWLIELVTVLVFTVEYILRIFVAEHKPTYIFSFFGIIDLLAILPFYVSFGLDLRSVRVFRLLRLLRIFKLMRYSKAINRFHRAYLIVKEELVLFSLVSLILLYLSAVGIHFFESEAQPEHFKSVFHSLWWAVVTLTTVGYGDAYPITIAGKIFTFFVLMIGLGIVAVPAGLVATALVQARKEEEQ